MRWLRAANHRQGLHNRGAGQVPCQPKRPAEPRDRLKAGIRGASFVARLRAFVRREVTCVADHPGLALVCWNRDVDYLTQRDVLRTCERHRRPVDSETLTPEEGALFGQLNELNDIHR